jgi:hypothetical protein
MKKFVALLAVLIVGVAALSSIALAGNGNGKGNGNGTGVTATPPATKTWAGAYSATFVRSASGIVDETNRGNSAGAQNEWASSDVWLQFRPTSNPTAGNGVLPNPDCDPAGLVTPQFTYHGNTDPELVGTATSGYFLPNVDYNVCVYLVNPVVASGTVDSHDPAGTLVSLPLDGHYRIDVFGVWTNGPWGPVDAEYTSTDNWITYQDGFNAPWNSGSANYGDLMIGGQFVDWGPYGPNHAYSYTAALPAGSLNLAVLDGPNGVALPSWYGDNSGFLNYTISYLGL